MNTVTLPNRDFLEEFFPTCARFALDVQARCSLRTLAEMKRMLDGLDRTMAGIDEAAPHHYNTLDLGYRKLCTDAVPPQKITDKGLAEHVAAALAQATPEQVEYHMQSWALMYMCRLIGHMSAGLNASGQQQLWLDMGKCTVSAMAPMIVLAEQAVRMSVIRDKPFVRFDVCNYIHFRYHWDDIDADGVPRVSNDGYRNI